MMLKKFASVSGFTLLSRITGFFRDVVIAAMLGSGLLADAYFVAQRLPNHFRAIFGEGAFNSAFVPAYARALGDDGDDAARRFAGEALTLLVMLLIPLSLLAMWQMPFVIDSLAPGFAADPEKYATAITLTRITFPYLLMVSIVTLLSGVLNAHDRFATAAAAPILLNLAILAALGVAFLFPTAAHAAAWGIVLSGALQLALLGWDAHRLGIMPHFARPRLDPAMKRFFAALGPAVIGSAAVQIAIFADTIIASMLPTGGVSAISYADRLYQLPVGLIGIAAGTVLLPEMSRRFAEGQDDQAYAAQNRSMLHTDVVGTVSGGLFDDPRCHHAWRFHARIFHGERCRSLCLCVDGLWDRADPYRADSFDCGELSCAARYAHTALCSLCRNRCECRVKTCVVSTPRRTRLGARNRYRCMDQWRLSACPRLKTPMDRA
jgi:putative peptidoglycan lipid II flippase